MSSSKSAVKTKTTEPSPVTSSQRQKPLAQVTQTSTKYDDDDHTANYDDDNDGYDMEQMEAMREYENQRMAEVFTQVLGQVFTYENITLPETILTLSQALDTHNKTQEGILLALNKIADKLAK